MPYLNEYLPGNSTDACFDGLGDGDGWGDSLGEGWDHDCEVVDTVTILLDIYSEYGWCEGKGHANGSGCGDGNCEKAYIGWSDAGEGFLSTDCDA